MNVSIVVMVIFMKLMMIAMVNALAKMNQFDTFTLAKRAH